MGARATLQQHFALQQSFPLQERLPSCGSQSAVTSRVAIARLFTLRVLATTFAVAAMPWLAVPAAASWTTSLVSRAGGAATTPAGGSSLSRGMTPDGRFVLFGSVAANVIVGVTDANSANDVFVLDRQTGITDLVSRSAASATTPGDRFSNPVAITPDGRYVLFTSLAANLVAGFVDANGTGMTDVFVFDRQTGLAQLASGAGASPTTTGNFASSAVAITPDGRYILFGSYATDLASGVTDTNATQDVFVFDRQAGSVELVSQSAGSTTTTPDNSGTGIAITPDGRYVLYESWATNVVAGVTDANTLRDAYVYDRTSGVTELINRSAASATTTSNTDGWPLAISTDGRYVLLITQSTDYLTGLVDTNGGFDVLVFDRVASVTQLISRNATSATTSANGRSDSAVMTPDGRYLAFATYGTDLLAGITDANAAADLYVFDRQTSTGELVSHTAASPSDTGSAFSAGPQISTDGRFVAFDSNSTDLIPGFIDLNGASGRDLYVYDRLGTTGLVSHAATSASSGADQNTYAIVMFMSDTGLDVLFFSAATNLIAGFTNANGTAWDVFVARDDAQAPTDPTIDATSPLASIWSSDNTVAVDWSGAADEPLGSGLAGYSVVFDQLPAGLPDSSVDVVHAVDPHTTTSTPLADGNSWYFHLRTCDLAGNCTATVDAGPFFIDTTPASAPGALTSPSHGDGLPHANAVIDLSWAAVSDASGVVYRVVFDANPTGSCPGSGGGGATNASSAPLAAGTWFAHVCAVDGAGNVGAVTDGGPYLIAASVADIPALSPFALALLALVLAGAAGVVSRRRRALD